jgi:hypothetical protein
MKTATELAQQIADQELEACCQALYDRYDRHPITSIAARDMRDWLREARRPKPLSLKQRALSALIDGIARGGNDPNDIDTIRRALESIPDSE